ncbi:MAG: HAMP domain-containing sensor histidine kinase, partial [Proteobacteria bacterium]|nr:HAMP domain-containing sensor histidine kinase [Pseudomonadota bacterium]
EQLLTFAHNDPSRLAARPVDLSHVAPKAIAMARVGTTGDAISTRFEPAPRVMARESDLVQLILNLLVNAIHATDGRGPIQVEIGPADGGTALRVLDRGPGIPPDVLVHVFDPFFTTKPAGAGTGLGLSLSYDLARQHGGRLEADNRAHGGAVFTLWLPGHAESHAGADLDN